MAASRKGAEFLNSEEYKEFKDALYKMTSDSTYKTEATYSPNADKYPDHLIPFIDKHLSYISTHPAMDTRMYIANLKLMTRIR